ncbi:HvfC/BufC N-terminal domain-containing protein [Vibrio sp. WXL210]|uniref:HvfC/BufC N-terminal domain-containing protein n=1 Tax=Vibrio sp. WXL210 TaxID=3450709 RepID=UPI003EC4AA4F
MELAQLQNQFAKALRYQANGEDCDIVSNHFSANDRIQIYRNNFVISLSEVLSATYPMVELLVGEECFTQMARQHVLQHPLTKADVSFYGDKFDQTIAQFPKVVEAAPYLEDVARFEWQMDLALHLANQPLESHILPIGQLANIAPEQQAQIVLELYPWARVIASPFAVFDLFNAMQSDCFDNLDIHCPQLGVIHTLPNGHRTPITLEPEVHQLLVCLRSKQSMGEIEPELLSHLNILMEKALIAGFTLKNN